MSAEPGSPHNLIGASVPGWRLQSLVGRALNASRLQCPGVWHVPTSNFTLRGQDLWASASYCLHIALS